MSEKPENEKQYEARSDGYHNDEKNQHRKGIRRRSETSGEHETSESNAHSVDRNIVRKRSMSVSSSTSDSSSESSHKKKRSKRKDKKHKKKKKDKHKKKKQKSTRRDGRQKNSESDDDDDPNVRRSIISGKRIKMSIEKTEEDLTRERARKEMLKFMNSSF